MSWGLGIEPRDDPDARFNAGCHISILLLGRHAGWVQSRDRAHQFILHLSPVHMGVKSKAPLGQGPPPKFRVVVVDPPSGRTSAYADSSRQWSPPPAPSSPPVTARTG